MPRNMSFAMTTEQFRDQSKDVTRRFGWWFLKPGDIVNGVEKAMGLQRGEKIVRLGQIEIVSTRAEPLNAITLEDVVREGFPDWTPERFVQMLVDHYKIQPDATCNRIEFKYVNPLTTFPEFMNGLCNAPHDTEVCAVCGGCGYNSVMCCSGEDCGCRGLPTDFEPCSAGCPQASDELIKEWAKNA